MSDKELFNWRSQNVTSNSIKMGLRYKPFCFTEYGVLMLSSVLRSQQANDVNISTIRVYNKMKELLVLNKDILLKLEKLETTSGKNADDIKIIFSYIKKLIDQPAKEKTSRIGFKKDW